MPTPGILPQLIKRLKQLRQDAGLTQEQFAERAGMSYKYYQQVEAGRKRDLRLSTLERLAHAHRVDLSELLAKHGTVIRRRHDRKGRQRDHV
jgi:transcriptional regulator with XRE-family HTH domain